MDTGRKTPLFWGKPPGPAYWEITPKSFGPPKKIWVRNKPPWGKKGIPGGLIGALPLIPGQKAQGEPTLIFPAPPKRMGFLNPFLGNPTMAQGGTQQIRKYQLFGNGPPLSFTPGKRPAHKLGEKFFSPPGGKTVFFFRARGNGAQTFPAPKLPGRFFPLIGVSGG